MTHPRPRDTRDEVDGIVSRHQLDYSLGQLRLVGLLLLVLELSTLLLAGSFASVEAPTGRLHSLIDLSPALPLLPVGFGLYLVGGGHRRHRREQPWTGALHWTLLPLGLILLLLLPAVTIHDAATLFSQRQLAPLSALQQHLLNPVHLVTTVLLQGITGAGLVLMQLRGRRQMQRVGLTPSLFFRTEATGPVQQHRRRSTD
ncbi:hypothetical protein KBZ12_16480 [Cyanobium sp. Cruz CV13-4-11]|uniref:hypothetical protein n=1 Tax=unclassified Cyanobium TaxID=2627006 RepID=UPI0020CCF909|nr:MULTISPECIES: hypothetical protein [unclassified Cyanobium]MCP9902203.1 hypothetical protein [Cyanobium sp. Cruz CV11-17]MCP9921047.1 hypothetical protein [Cyanobium sp. Cruz CV13-4-11]